ncbi:unnamed protein product [Orchesella dallaii]
MIALGLANGKVILSTFGTTVVSKEFVPKHTRQVNSLQWNRANPNFLAVGLDKARSDFAVSIWDVSLGSKYVNGYHSDVLRPKIELGISETANSVAWVQARSLLVGMNGKHIKLFDLRDSQPKLSSTATTKAVYGICVDNVCAHRVASFAENQVFVWDTRNFEKPFLILNHSKHVSKLGWCPTRAGLLACLEKDSSSLTLHDVNHAVMSTEEGEPAVLERRLTPAYPNELELADSTTVLSSFAWHPTEEHLITTATFNGVIWSSFVYERLTLNWSPTSILGWSDGKRTINFIDNTDDIYTSLDDISVKMKLRAKNGYGLKAQLRDNGNIVADDEDLKNLWTWLDFCKSLTEKEKHHLPSISTVTFPGAQTVLKMESNNGGGVTSTIKSEIINNSSFDLRNSKTYRSEERSFVQQLCGWSVESIHDLQGTPTRKAAIALFHLKLRLAIKILNESDNSIVAMAIAGFSDDQNSLWRELALAKFNQLSDPYIRAIFAFLTEADSNYETILHESELTVADRLGFACSFLPDAKLISFVQEISNDMIKKGNLYGILLTGMTPQSIPLLQRYLNLTADVQSVAVLAIRTMASDIASSAILKLWIERYRDLLDSWKLWDERAEFDILKNRNNPALIPQPEVTVSCNFCGKSISAPGVPGIGRSTQIFSRFITTDVKLKQTSCCPSCRKPLPRCSICLLHMGTILGSGTEQPVVDMYKIGACPEALSWYTWCQTCRHGGHTVHLQQWFRTQAECPVSGCTCKCINLDRVLEFPS